MKSYIVTVKNINARVSNMTLPIGDNHVFDNITASNEGSAINKAVKRLFDGCTFITENRNLDGSFHGQITAKGNQQFTSNTYGRIYVHATAAN